MKRSRSVAGVNTSRNNNINGDYPPRKRSNNIKQGSNVDAATKSKTSSSKKTVQQQQQSKRERVRICQSDIQLFKLCRRGLSTELLVHIIQFAMYPLVTIPCSPDTTRISSKVIAKCYGRLKTDVYRRHFLLTNRFCLKISNMVSPGVSGVSRSTTSNHNINKRGRCIFLPELPIHTEVLVIDIRKVVPSPTTIVIDEEASHISSTDNNNGDQLDNWLDHLLKIRIPNQYSESKLPYLRRIDFCERENDGFRGLAHLLQTIPKTNNSGSNIDEVGDIMKQLQTHQAIPFYRDKLMRYFQVKQTGSPRYRQPIHYMLDPNCTLDQVLVLLASFPNLTTYHGPQDICNLAKSDWSSAISIGQNLTDLHMQIWDCSFISHILKLPKLQHLFLQSDTVLQLPANLDPSNDNSTINSIKKILDDDMSRQKTHHIIDSFELKATCPSAYSLLKLPVRKLFISECCSFSLKDLELLRDNDTISELKISFSDHVGSHNKKTVYVLKNILDSCTSLVSLELDMKNAVSSESFYDALSKCKYLQTIDISIFYFNQFASLLHGSSFTSVILKCHFSCPLEKLKNKCEEVVSKNRMLRRLELIQCIQHRENDKESCWGQQHYRLGDVKITFSTCPKLLKELQSS